MNTPTALIREWFDKTGTLENIEFAIISCFQTWIMGLRGQD